MSNDDHKDDRKQRIIRRIETLRAADYSYEALLRHAAEGWDWAGFMEEAYEQQQEILSIQDQALDISSDIEIRLQKVVYDLIDNLDISREAHQKIRLELPGLIERETAKTRSKLAKEAVEARIKRTGIRENKVKLMGFWASGQYSTKERCAYEWADELGMAQSTARRALQGAKDPNPWPAKDAE